MKVGCGPVPSARESARHPRVIERFEPRRITRSDTGLGSRLCRDPCLVDLTQGRGGSLVMRGFEARRRRHGLLIAIACLVGSLLAAPGAAAVDCDIEGTPRGESLTGTFRGEVICGKGGDDRIRGFGGDDSLYGGVGRDRISGGLGADFLGGSDHIDSLRGGAGNDVLEGGNWRECSAARVAPTRSTDATARIRETSCAAVPVGTPVTRRRMMSRSRVRTCAVPSYRPDVVELISAMNLPGWQNALVVTSALGEADVSRQAGERRVWAEVRSSVGGSVVT